MKSNWKLVRCMMSACSSMLQKQESTCGAYSPSIELPVPAHRLNNSSFSAEWGLRNHPFAASKKRVGCCMQDMPCAHEIARTCMALVLERVRSMGDLGTVRLIWGFLGRPTWAHCNSRMPGNEQVCHVECLAGGGDCAAG